jgi:hypothetical protein
MSLPEEPLPLPQAAPLEAAPLVPTAPAQPMSPRSQPEGAPYRVPAPPAEPPEPERIAALAPRKPRPIMGPALSVFAVLLWSFVVFGQFTTSWWLGAPLDQKTAVTFVLLTTLAAWLASLRRSRIVVAPRSTMHLAWRSVGVAVVAFLSFLVCLVAATAAGGVSSRNHDMLIAMVLVVVSLLAAIGGPKLTSPAPFTKTHAQRVVLVLLWTAGALLTLVAGADLANNG